MTEIRMTEPLDLEAIRERAIYYRGEGWVDELYGEFVGMLAEVERLRKLLRRISRDIDSILVEIYYPSDGEVAYLSPGEVA